MADKKITDLPALTTASANDLLPIVDDTGVVTKKVTVTGLAAGVISEAPAGGIVYSKLLATIFSGQVQTQANAGTIGGTISYLNLGGIKMMWLESASVTIAGSTVFSGYTVIPPTSFFSAAPTLFLVGIATANNNLITARGYAKTSSLLTITGQNAAGGSGNCTISVFAIGT